MTDVPFKIGVCAALYLLIMMQVTSCDAQKLMEDRLGAIHTSVIITETQTKPRG